MESNLLQSNLLVKEKCMSKIQNVKGMKLWYL